jgi:hypothetical protein
MCDASGEVAPRYADRPLPAKRHLPDPSCWWTSEDFPVRSRSLAREVGAVDVVVDDPDEGGRPIQGLGALDKAAPDEAADPGVAWC